MNYKQGRFRVVLISRHVRWFDIVQVFNRDIFFYSIVFCKVKFQTKICDLSIEHKCDRKKTNTGISILYMQDQRDNNLLLQKIISTMLQCASCFNPLTNSYSQLNKNSIFRKCTFLVKIFTVLLLHIGICDSHHLIAKFFSSS